MATIRVNKNKNYTVMSNYHLRDKNLSLKAKGLLSVMLSLPDNWDYSITGLVAISKENETAITTALGELKQYKYLQVTKLMPGQTKSGRIEYIYDIYEEPKQEGKKQDLEILPLEIQDIEEPTQINNNKEIIKKQNTKHIYGEYKHVRLTDEELNKLKSEYGEQTTQDAIKYLDEYIEMKGTQYKSHYMAMRKWVFDAIHKNNKQDKIITHEYSKEFLNSLYDSLE